MATASSRSRPLTAIDLLKADHKKVQTLFKQFEKIRQEGDGEEKSALAKQICNELTIHTMIEEEIFYPAVREAIEDQDLMDEAEVEHAGTKHLVKQLQSMQSSDRFYDAKVRVLGEQVRLHIEEEQNEMFPKTRNAHVDMAKLGAELSARKVELLEDMGLRSNISPPTQDNLATKSKAENRR